MFVFVGSLLVQTSLKCGSKVILSTLSFAKWCSFIIFSCCVQFDSREADKGVEGNALERTSALLLECPEARV